MPYCAVVNVLMNRWDNGELHKKSSSPTEGKEDSISEGFY